MTFTSNTLYALVDPEHYDDEFGEGFDHVHSTGETDGCFIADCWVVDAKGNKHPGMEESPVPVRYSDVIGCPMERLRILHNQKTENRNKPF